MKPAWWQMEVTMVKVLRLYHEREAVRGMGSLIDLEGPMTPMTIINMTKEDSSIRNIGSLLRMKG